MPSVWWSPGVSVTTEMKPGHAIAPFAGDPILPEEPIEPFTFTLKSVSRGRRGTAGVLPLRGSAHPHTLSHWPGGRRRGRISTLFSLRNALRGHFPTTAVPMAPSGSHIFPLQPCLLLQPKSKCSKPRIPSSFLVRYCHKGTVDRKLASSQSGGERMGQGGCVRLYLHLVVA